MERIRQIHVMSDCTYGRARVQAELHDMGLCGDDAQKTSSKGSARSGEASIHGHGYQSVMGGRYDLCAHLGWVSYLAVVVDVYSR
jgi:hypothetical protein